MYIPLRRAGERKTAHLRVGFLRFWRSFARIARGSRLKASGHVQNVPLGGLKAELVLLSEQHRKLVENPRGEVAEWSKAAVC